MSEPYVLLSGAWACWLATGIAIWAGWRATFGGPVWVWKTCIPIATTLLLLSLILMAFGFAGAWGGLAASF